MTAMLILVSGLPGTGKTTFADALAGTLGANRLNSDIVRSELGKRGMYDAETKKLIYDELCRRTADLLKKQETVIVDATFYKKSLRQLFIELAEKCGAPWKWIEICAAETTVEERLKKRRAYSEADYEVHRKIREGFEPLAFSHLALWSDQTSLEEMVKEAKRYVQ
jgi:hypothetical protein